MNKSDYLNDPMLRKVHETMKKDREVEAILHEGFKKLLGGNKGTYIDIPLESK